MSEIVYLVGDKDAAKRNSWLAMTDSAEEAQRLLDELPSAVQTKEVKVPPPRRRKRNG